MHLDVEDLIALKAGGHFRIDPHGARCLLTIQRDGEPAEHIVCPTAGRANQLRIALSDEGLAGFVSTAL